jgi:deoxyhypusine monooxygenase
MWDTPSLAELQKALGDPSNPIGMRMRAAYHLRHVHDKAENENDQILVVEALSKGLLDPRHGSLMRHEFAYVMGQLKDKRCCETLETILQDDTDCVMVRHEAAEALGAIGADRSKPALKAVMDRYPDRPELSDTCRLAMSVMDWRAAGGDPENAPAACACMLSPYSSVDPAPPHPSHVNKSDEELGDILCNDTLPIFERYRAMFSLRNRGGEGAVKELCRALVKDESSALLRHEVAYVLGQMQHPACVEALEESLRRKDEHEMVRHESAEALGAIEGRWDEVEAILTEFSTDENVVVRESCCVALDAADYWGHNNSTANEGNGTNKEAMSFTQQKNEANDDARETREPSRILVNHFNVQ